MQTADLQLEGCAGSLIVRVSTVKTFPQSGIAILLFDAFS
jgi:hypothetical protein